MAPFNVTCQPVNSTVDQSGEFGKEDRNALLYIVVTLLFYSMGIIIGIITYLKREQAEMEEDKMFDMYMQLKREPFNLYKKERVQQMALYLKQIEERQAAREKIESWRTMDHSQPQSCRRHAQRHSSCPDCKRVPENIHSFNGGATLGIPESVWGDARGSTALLCSLTLGMCEPLLTPESIKRVAFPDKASLETKSTNKTSLGLPLIKPSVPGPSKSNFKRSSLSVHYSDCVTVMPNDKIPNNEIKQQITKAVSHETDLDSPGMFDKGDIELKKLRQFNYAEVRAVFQQNPTGQEQNGNVCDNISHDIHSIPTPRDLKASSTTTFEITSTSNSEQNHDNELRSSELAVHASTGNRPDALVGEDKQCMDIPGASVDHVMLPSPEGETCKTVTEFLAQRLPASTSDISDGIRHLHQFEDNPSPQTQELHFQAQHQQNIPHITSSIILPQAMAWYPSRRYQLPLQLFLLPQQQLQQCADVRPKIFPTVLDIPSSASRDEAIAAMCTTSLSNTSPKATQHVDSPLRETRKKSGFQGMDISDVTRARKLGLNWKNKTAEKKTGSRAQPERRGALFFTQRSLQKDLDSPKSSAARKHSRPAVFGRQESVDSHVSRTSDMSESVDSPLLHQGSDPNSAVNPSSPSSSAGSSSVSPTSKHPRGIPHLLQPQTVDASKTLQL